MKIVKVSWRDSHRYMYQMPPDEEVSITVIESAGWLVRKEKKQIVLAQDIIDEDLRGVLVIPTENILKIKVLSSTPETKK